MQVLGVETTLNTRARWSSCTQTYAAQWCDGHPYAYGWSSQD